MPDSRSERIFFLSGFAVIVALIVALIPAYHHYSGSAPAAAPQLPSSGSPAAQQTSYRPGTPAKPAAKVRRKSPAAQARAKKPAAKTKPAASSPTSAPSKAAAKPSATAQAKLTLAASRGDCWVEVRSDSAQGKVLYIGTLTKGKSFKLGVSKLWIRFGAPQNVDLVIAGKPAKIPNGTQNVVVTSLGVKSAPA